MNSSKSVYNFQDLQFHVDIIGKKVHIKMIDGSIHHAKIINLTERWIKGSSIERTDKRPVWFNKTKILWVMIDEVNEL